MDNLTHSLFGALIGQTGLKRKTGLALPALIIGANLPDVDAACFFWLEGVEHLAFRRGITHGPPAMVVLPLILAAFLWGWDRWQNARGKRPEARLPVHFGWLYTLALIGCLSHPALDWMNVYGIRLLEPFSSQWFHGDVLFIVDIWLWLGMGFAVWFSLRREKAGGEWRRPARVAMASVFAYIGLNAGLTHWHESRILRESPRPDLAIASPVPLAFWNRQMIAGGEGRYTIAGVPAGVHRITDDDKATIVAEVPAAAPLLFWARTPIVVLGEDGTCLLGDARFSATSAGRAGFTIVMPGHWCRA